MIWEIDDKKKVIEGLDEDGKPDPEYAAKLGLKSAPYGRRALASIIEFAIYGLLLSPYVIFVVPYFVRIMTGMLDWYGFINHPRFILLLLVGLFSNLFVIAFVIVQISLHGKKGVTVGKAFTGIRSVNVKTLEAPGFWRAAWRGLLLYLTFLIPVIGPALFFASPFFDSQRRRRSWLDYAGGTWFVDIKQGLNPYDRKRMRIARKNAKVELNEDEEQLPSLATEAARSEPLQYVPSARTSSGVLGASVPDPGSAGMTETSAPAPASAITQFARPAEPVHPSQQSAPSATHPANPRPVATPEPAPQAEPYRPGMLSGRAGEPISHVPPAAPPPGGLQQAYPQQSAPQPQTSQPHASAPQHFDAQGFDGQNSAPQSTPSPYAAAQSAAAQPSVPQPSAPPVVAPPQQAVPPVAAPVYEQHGYEAPASDTVAHGSYGAGLDDDVAETRVAHRRVAAAAVIALDTGETFELQGSALLGRNPRPSSEEEIAHALPIDDPSHSISKTHLLLEVIDGKVFAVDRHSTNGSSLERAGQTASLAPGERFELLTNDIVRFGDRSLQIRLP